MPEPRRKFWIGVAVGILGLAVGASNLMRGFGDGGDLQNTILGAVCIVFAAGWMVYLLVSVKRHGLRRG